MGGIYGIVMLVFAFLDYYVSKPFDELHLAVSFSKLKNLICQQEGLIDKGMEFDQEYTRRLNCPFYLYLFAFKRTPSFLWSIFC